MRPLRRKVSLNKRRYQENGFDLDLTYITGNVIAMGYPSVGFESIYRNPRSEVKEFFDKYHKDKYKVYNLCIESSRQYDVNEFYTRVANYPFADHQAPPLTMMGELCSDVEKWLAADEKNVAAIHCKAGKGRAGMMICCYLLHSKFAKTASEAMTYYAEKRTKNGEGVTIPSQRRYINYYEKVLKYGMPEQPSIKLNSITISTSKYILHKGASEPWVEVLARGKDRVFNSPAARAGSEDAVIDLRDLEIKGDYKVIIYDKAFDKKEVCHFWFNTAFVHENKLVIQKPDLDKIWKDCKKNKKFQQDFFVELSFKDSKISAMNKLIRNKKRKAQKKKSQAKKKPVKKTDSSEESSSESESSESESETSESESEDDKKKKAPKKAVARKKKQESSEEESSESESESESEDEPKKSNNNNNKKSETKKEEPKKVDSKKEDPKKKDSKKEEPKKQDSKKDVKKEEPKKQDSKKDVKKEDPKKKDSKKDVKKEDPKKVEEPKKEEPKKEEPKKVEEPKPIIKEPTPQAPVTSNEKAEESSSDSESDSSDSSSSSADSIVRRSRNNTPKEPPQNSYTPAPAPSPAPVVVPVTHQASTDSSSSSDSSGPELQPVVVAPKSEPPKEAPKPAKRAPEDESTDSSSSEDSSDSESD